MCGEEGFGGGAHTKRVTTDISWKLLDDVSVHQRTATAIVGLIGKQRQHCHSCVLQDYLQCVAQAPRVCVRAVQP